jgi:hypothetical protein
MFQLSMPIPPCQTYLNWYLLKLAEMHAFILIVTIFNVVQKTAKPLQS